MQAFRTPMRSRRPPGERVTFKHILWFDTETYSPVPITRGIDVYSREVEVMIMAYAIDKGVVKVHDCTDDPLLPDELEERLRDPATLIVAHNAYFDRTVMRNGQYQMDIPPHRWHCTYAQALAHSLPGGLGLLAEVLNVKTRKQASGKDYINLFCKPRPKKQKIRRATRWTHPDAWAEFMAYAGDDVGAMRDCFYAMPRRNYKGEEKELWDFDQEINDRGFFTDIEFANAAVDLLKADKERLDARVAEITNGEVKAATQRDKLLQHLLMEYGVIVDSLRADDLEDLLAEDWLPKEVKELLKLRITAAMNSTAKYTRLLNMVGPDGRMRGTLQFAGASRTGRWGGRGYQPQNLRRPTMKADDIERCIELIKAGDVEGVELFADNLREACSNALRGLMIAAPGKKLVVSDWSNIEGRDAAWLVGEQWKLDAFRAYDTIIPGKFDKKGKPLRAGPDLYKLAYSNSFGIPVDTVNDFQRQIGKGEELSLQYGGGVGAFLAVSYSYGLDLDELGRMMPELAPYEVIAQARAIYQWALKKGKTLGLSEPVYVACEAVKALWRQANSRFERGWADLENAARMAITYPREKFEACRCTFECAADWLMITLPSGRTLMYPTPRILADNSISYAGQVNKQWRRIKTYGGKLLENITQASSRDVLAYNLLRLKREYGSIVDVVMHVHDEIVIEVAENGTFNLNVLNNLLTTNPPWAVGLPLAAEGFEAKRYAKH